MSLAEAIKIRFLSIMEEKEFTQYDFYTKGGIAKSTVSQVLNGTRERVAVKTIFEMVSTLEVPLNVFFDDPIFSEVED